MVTTAGGLPLEPLQAPVNVLDIEVTEPLPGLAPTESPAAPPVLRALVRLHTRPVGVVTLRPGPGGMSADDVATVISQQLGARIAAHLESDGLGGPAPVEADGTAASDWPDGRPRCLRRRDEALAKGRPVTVIVATRDRTASLARCLDSLLVMEYPRFDIVVVDNAPSTESTAELIASAYAGGGIRYLREPRRGLGAAHNCGIQVAEGEILAFTDDDVIVDRHWLAAIAEAFEVSDRVGAVTGLIQPAELRSITQLLLEHHGGFAKGFDRKIFDLEANRPADWRFPLAAGQCGSGANMAFEAGCLRRLGGFDPALGTGTRAKGGDDLAAFFKVVTTGHRLVYEPAALVRHRHRDDEAALTNQAYGYGVGLGAYLTDAFARHPGVVVRTALQAPGARTRSPGPMSHARLRASTSQAELARLGRRGAVVGPFAYAASRWSARGAQRPSKR